MDRNEPLSTVLAAMPDWQKVYSDEVSVIFVRRDALLATTPTGSWNRCGEHEVTDAGNVSIVVPCFNEEEAFAARTDDLSGCSSSCR